MLFLRRFTRFENLWILEDIMFFKLHCVLKHKLKFFKVAPIKKIRSAVREGSILQNCVKHFQLKLDV